MPQIHDPDNQGAPSGQLNGYDWKHIGLVFLAAFAAFFLTWLASVLVPDLQTHGVISAAIAGLLTTVIAALQRFINDGTKVVRLILVGLSLALFGSSSAQAAPDDTAILVDGAVAAKYIVYVDGQGGVTFSPLARVVRPGPSPTPTPTPGPLTDRAKAIRDVAMKVTADQDRANTAKGLAELFRQVASVSNQASSPASLEAALSLGLDRFLASRGPAAATAWKPVRDTVGTQLTVLDFNKAPLADYATLFGEVAAGLDASAPAGKGISPDMLKLILQIIEIILALFKIPVPPLP